MKANLHKPAVRPTSSPRNRFPGNKPASTTRSSRAIDPDKPAGQPRLGADGFVNSLRLPPQRDVCSWGAELSGSNRSTTIRKVMMCGSAVPGSRPQGRS